MLDTFSAKTEPSNEYKDTPLIRDIRSWVGLPIEDYTRNVEQLIDNLSSIDNSNETTELLLNDNVKEYFANGMYARELTIPSNTALISRIHMEEGISVLSEGTIVVMDREGYREISAPYTFVSPEGTQRIGYTLTKCTWVSLFRADKQDDMLSVVTAESLDEYNRRKICQE
jgi:hypothetical protein